MPPFVAWFICNVSFTSPIITYQRVQVEEIFKLMTTLKKYRNPLSVVTEKLIAPFSKREVNWGWRIQCLMIALCLLVKKQV